MNNDLLAYLQQDGIGKVIARGLADVYTHKPNAPVKYLAAWLKKYSANQKEIAALGKQQHIKADSLKVFTHKIQADAKVSEEEKKKKQIHNKQIEDFKKIIANHQYQQELLVEQVPQFIQHLLGLTGAYIGYVNHPPKQITDQDQDENAHLNTSIPKLINYIGASKSHQALMLGKTLALDKGVTAAALALSLDDPQPNEDGTVEHKDKYIYIPNVVKNQNVTYFRLPKLGAYITVPLAYNSYLTEHIFDVALENRQKYLGQLQEFKKLKEEELKEIIAQKDTIKLKLTELTEKGADQASIEAAKTQLTENAERQKQKQAQHFDQEHTQLQTEKREFLVCGDTLGKDKEISESERLILIQLIKHFRDSWEHKEKQLLYKDVEYQISIQRHLDKKADVVLENIQKIIDIPAETKTQFDQIEDEQIRQYKKLDWQLTALKKQLRDGPEYLATFFKLKNFRVVKYKQIIQTILHFLKFEKKDINLLSKTILNWKKIRATHINANTFFAVLDYNPEGPKNGEYPQYCKIQHILQTLEKYQEADLFHYNVGLGAIVRLIKKQIAYRQANIELRRTQKENERKQRNLMLEENEKIAEQKRLALQKHKQSLISQDLQAFKEEEWSVKYDQEFPLKEIPPEIIEDIDNDF